MNTFDLKIEDGAKGCLVDTSIWVEVLRSRDRKISHPVLPIIEELSEADFIYTSRVIVAEIIAGARNRTEAQRLEQDFEGYRFCVEDVALFKEAGYTRQAYTRNFRRRPTPGLIDCYLVNLAKKGDLVVFTADRALRSATEFCKLKGIFFSIQARELSYIA